MSAILCFATEVSKRKNEATKMDVNDNTFVRKDFYVEPPAKGSSVSEWNKWVKKDANKARAAKAAHTKAQKHADMPTWLSSDAPWSMPNTVTGSDGVHRQGSMVGFTGSTDAGNVQVERVCPMPSPEALVDMKAALEEIAERTNKRGGKRDGKSSRRRKNKKLRLIKGGKE